MRPLLSGRIPREQNESTHGSNERRFLRKHSSYFVVSLCPIYTFFAVGPRHLFVVVRGDGASLRKSPNRKKQKTPLLAGSLVSEMREYRRRMSWWAVADSNCRPTD